MSFIVVPYLFIFRERGREGEREGEKHPCVVASHSPCIGDLAYNPDIWPDWELNQQPIGFQARTQSTEAHEPRQELFFKFLINLFIYFDVQKAVYI